MITFTPFDIILIVLAIVILVAFIISQGKVGIRSDDIIIILILLFFGYGGIKYWAFILFGVN